MFDLVVARPESEETLMRRVAVTTEAAGESCGDRISPRGEEVWQQPGSR